MDEQDQYESVGLDDSIEDERNLDEIMADRRAAEAELHARDVRTGVTADRKLPRMLHDQGMASHKVLIFHGVVLLPLYL